ncbi:MAG: T9SS type A sorting domain-containing protein [Bacteroidota bacterium]
MKKSLLLFLSLFLTLLLSAQSYTLTVNNGYGSGSYAPGTIVHIWSEAYSYQQSFDTWSGDTQYLDRPKEWHTTLMMPNQDLSISAQIKALPPSATITFEEIMGRDRPKAVYHYLPPDPKGLLLFFHGTGGSAQGIISRPESRSFLNSAIADGYGILVTESEEATLNTDLNGDDKLRWQSSPVDTVNNVDYRNIRILLDTFRQRGAIAQTTPIVSVGMSNGGNFSAVLSAVYNFKAGVSYCAQANLGFYQLRQSPFAFRMARFDENENVGPEGNAIALAHDSVLQVRGICHDYLLNDRQPLHPERFARIPGISVDSSRLIFGELKAEGQLDAEDYALPSAEVADNYLMAPATFPVLRSLNPSLRLIVLRQLGVINAEHRFYSDFNQATLDFFNTLCETTVSAASPTPKPSILQVFPNPTHDQVHFVLPEGFDQLVLFDPLGRRLIQLRSPPSTGHLDLSHLEPGCYFIRAKKGGTVLYGQVVKQ